MNEFEIAISAEELDLDHCVMSGQVFRWSRHGEGRWLGIDGEHWYAVEKIHGGYAVQSTGTEADFRAHFRLEETLVDVVAEIDASLPESAAVAASGFRLMRPSCPRETLFAFLCSPNNHLLRITSMVNALADFGEPMSRGHGRRFPSLERIAGIDESELRAKGFGYRSPRIPGAARALLERGGESYLAELKDGPYEMAFNELIKIDGIGPKLSDCICLFAFDHGLAVPVDTHMWQAATRNFFPQWHGTALTELRYRAVGDYLRSRLGERAGWAHLYLYRENQVMARSRKYTEPKVH